MDFNNYAKRQLFVKAKGFTIIELVVVIAVLAALAAVGLPAFIKFIYGAQSAAAQHSMTNYAKNCQRGQYSSTFFFGLDSIPGYSSSQPASCQVIATYTPDPESNNPTYVYDPATETVQCYYDSFKLEYPLCIVTEQITGYLARKEKIESSPLVQQDTYFERDCSGYAIVDGPTWSQAQANAKSLGGDLMTINDEAENIWSHKTYIDIGLNMKKDRYNTRHIFIGLKRGAGTGPQTTNPAGYSDGWISGQDSTWRPKYWGQTGEITDPDGNVQGTNLEGHQGGADYGALVVMDGFANARDTPGMTWNDFPEYMHNDAKGLVEVPICD